MSERDAARQARLQEDPLDTLDEELEMEIDGHPLGGDGGISDEAHETRRIYLRELFRLQGELAKLWDWVIETGHRLVVILEGRDAAGKGGAIKRIMQRPNPRVCRVVALSAPISRERTQWHFQRYVVHLPVAGEIVPFDRSWYNRVGVECATGFCTDEEYEESLRSVPEFEEMPARSGIQIVRYRLSVTDEEQEVRFQGCTDDPLKQWKLSPMDLENRRRWEAYMRAKEVMLERSHIPELPWQMVLANDKRHARLNCIHRLLSQVPYHPVPYSPVLLSERVHHVGYIHHPASEEMVVLNVY